VGLDQVAPTQFDPSKLHRQEKYAQGNEWSLMLCLDDAKGGDEQYQTGKQYKEEAFPYNPIDERAHDPSQLTEKFWGRRDDRGGDASPLTPVE
jgi:hypothetical protein